MSTSTSALASIAPPAGDGYCLSWSPMSQNPVWTRCPGWRTQTTYLSCPAPATDHFLLGTVLGGIEAYITVIVIYLVFRSHKRRPTADQPSDGHE